MDVDICRGLVINAPEFFADPAFQNWLNDGRPKMSWHRPGEQISEWSDVVVLVDPTLTGEGSDADMPDQFWNRIVSACRDHLGPSRAPTAHYHVRLTNLAA